MRKKGLKHTEQVLQENKYPVGFTKRMEKRMGRSREPEEPKKAVETVARIPYVEGLSEAILRVLHSLKIRTVIISST